MGYFFRLKILTFLLFDAVYFEYVTKVYHASKLKNNIKPIKTSLLMKVFKFFANVCHRIQNRIFFMLEIKILIVDVLDFENVTSQPCIKT